MKKRNPFLLFAAAAALCAAPAANAQTAFTYQGKLTDDCCPATGLYDLTFKVFDNTGPGTTGQQGSTVSLTRVPVTNGLFTVSLDFGSSVFTGARRWLQIDARTNNAALTAATLLPRTELTATPYSLYAQKAGMVTNGSITTSALATTTAPSANQILSYNGNSLQWIPTPTGTFALPYSATLSSPGPLLSLNNSGTGPAATFLGKVGIGTANPAAPLELKTGLDTEVLRFGYSSTDYHYISASFNGGANPFANYLGFNLEYTSSDVRRVLTLRGDGTVGIGTAEPGRRLTVVAAYDGDGIQVVGSQFGPKDAGYRLSDDTGNGAHLGLASFANAWFTGAQPGDLVLGANQGNIRIGVGTGLDTPVMSVGRNLVSIAQEGSYSYPRPGSNAKGAINLRMSTVGRSTGLTFSGGGRDDAQAGIYVYQDNAAGTTMHFATTDSYATGPQARMTISNTGGVGIGTQSPAFPLTVRTAPGYGIIHTDGTREVGTYVDGSGGWIGTRSNHPLHLFVNDGSSALRIDTDNSVSLRVLTITGGADIAEPFPMSTEEIPKGAVVTIDEDHPGQLKMSERAYDTRVAGIISGANGIKPGVSLHQEGALEGTDNVALSGRVYALADASHGPIKPGDLLTSSDTPGHCMKVTDKAKAQGAIIGKAMSALAEGKGMVLVLVSLQ